MRKVLVFLIMFFFVTLMTGCKNMFENVDNYVESLTFQTGSFNLYVDGMEVCNLYAGPADSFSYYMPVFAVENTMICEIRKTEANSVVIYGKQKGSTLLIAKMGNKTAMAVVNVRENKGNY